MLQTYSIVEIFYSIQGEGRFTGWPAVFIRLAGCNLKCEWCDTDLHKKEDLSQYDISQRVYALTAGKKREDILIILTGGEPTLYNYLDLVTHLITTFPSRVTMETNGRHSANIELIGLRKLQGLWVTVSPKIAVENCEPYFNNSIWCGDEIKIVLDPKFDKIDKRNISELPNGRLKNRFSYFYIQPCSGDIQTAITFVKENPQWKLSLQTQKIMGIS